MGNLLKALGRLDEAKVCIDQNGAESVGKRTPRAIVRSTREKKRERKREIAREIWFANAVHTP